MELYIYGPAIELQGIIDSFSSLRWRRRFFEPGEFELHVPATDDNLTLLSTGNIIHRLDRSEAGIIEGVTIESTDDSGDEITVTGRMGSSMLAQRIIMPTVNFSGAIEVAMRQIVSDNAITARPIDGLTLGALQNLTPTCSFQAEYKTVLSVLEALSKSAPMGFRVRLDVPDKAWVFEVYDGTDRSVTQTAVPYVLFSSDFGNISGAKYTMDNTGYCNFAYVGGEDNDNGRVISSVDQTNGKPKRELWVDANDIKSSVDTKADFTGDGTTTAFTLERTPIKINSVEISGSSTQDYILSGNTVSFTANAKDNFTGNGSITTFTLTHMPISASSVNISGYSASGYTLDGKTLTFSSAPDKDSDITVSYTYASAPISGVAIVISYNYVMTAGEYAAVLAQRGLEKLSSAVATQSFEGTAIDTGNFEYLVDWDLGDIVSFEKWGITLNQRVTEVEEVYENGIVTITPTCGTPLPETLDLGSDT